LKSRLKSDDNQWFMKDPVADNNKDDRLRTQLMGISLSSPLIVASSVLTGDMGRIRFAEQFGAGGISTKMAMPVTPPVAHPDIILRPRGGGIVSPGDKRLFIDEASALVRQAKHATNLIVIANLLAPADDLDAWQRLAVELELAGADALELDISCPNISKDVHSHSRLPLGACIAQSPDATEQVTRAVKRAVKIPVLCKLTAQVTDIVEIARAGQRGGADAIVAINGIRAAPPIDIRNGGRPKYTMLEKHNLGTLTGDPLFPIACRMVAEIARAVDVPVIGCGGISTWQDAVEMMMWGASAVEICTAILVRGFPLIEQINQGITAFMVEQGYHSTCDFVGAALNYLVSCPQVVYRKFDLQIDTARCNMCRLCLAPGICTALSAKDNKIIWDSKQCLNCGTCLQVCQRHAFQIEYHP
jgi:dihydropyrimidine dehydrogenase (NAD+) subunit PreA